MKDNGLLAKAIAMMEDENLKDELIEHLNETRGDTGFMLKVLSERPRTFNPYLLKGRTIYMQPAALDKKTAELAAVAASSALRCEPCLEAHIHRALEEGATLDEVYDTLLISASIAESSTLAVGLRKYKQAEGKLKRSKSKPQEGGSNDVKDE